MDSENPPVTLVDFLLIGASCSVLQFDKVFVDVHHKWFHSYTLYQHRRLKGLHNFPEAACVWLLRQQSSI